MTTPPATRHVPSYDRLIWHGKAKDYCVVIPVINEGDRIGSLLRRMASLGVQSVADVIIVDGGSTDGSLTPELLESTQVRALLVKTGPGRLSAQLRCAYSFALDHGYEGIVTIDGNDKDGPEAIPEFVEAMRDGVDFVQASRFVPGGNSLNTPRSRDIAIRLIHAPALSLASGFRWTDTTQGFRGYRSRVLLDPRVAPFRHVFSAYELLAYLSYRVPRLGYTCRELPTSRVYPPGDVPTKIHGITGKIELLKVLALACLGRFNPS